MEKALLQEMIRDREICIQFLEKKLAGQDEKAKLLKKENEEISDRKQKDREVQRSELIQLWKSYDGILSRYQDLKDALDTRRQQQQEPSNGEGSQPLGPSLETYIEIMKAVPSDESNGSEDTSNYVVKMQSQLCKAMHGMGVMETQRHMTKGQTEHILKKAKDVLTEMREEQSNVELKMVNDLIVADTSKREVDSKRTLQHEDYSKQKHDLMEKIERQLDEATEDDGEAENDETLEEAKEELKEILEEGRQETEKLEMQNAETEEKIEALKIKAALAQGQDVVKDIVTSIEEEFAEREGSEDEGSDDGSY